MTSTSNYSIKRVSLTALLSSPHLWYVHEGEVDRSATIETRKDWNDTQGRGATYIVAQTFEQTGHIGALLRSRADALTCD